RMYAVRTAATRDLDELGDVEIGVGRGRATEGVGLVGEPDVQCVEVGIGIDRNAADAGIAARADDPYRNLATVGDEDLPHGMTLRGQRRRSRLCTWVVGGAEDVECSAR